MLPTTKSKLLTRWKGPYEGSTQVGPVYYDMVGPPPSKVYYINLLKEWQENEGLWAEVEDLDLQSNDGDTSWQRRLDRMLTPDQEPRVRALEREDHDVYSPLVSRPQDGPRPGVAARGVQRGLYPTGALVPVDKRTW